MEEGSFLVPILFFRAEKISGWFCKVPKDGCNVLHETASLATKKRNDPTNCHEVFPVCFGQGLAGLTPTLGISAFA